MIGKMTVSEKVSSEDKEYHALEICNRPWIIMSGNPVESRV